MNRKHRCARWSAARDDAQTLMPGDDLIPLSTSWNFTVRAFLSSPSTATPQSIIAGALQSPFADADESRLVRRHVEVIRKDTVRRGRHELCHFPLQASAPC